MATTVFRIEKTKEFVVMSNKFLRNKEMSLKAKGLLALCLALPEDWEYSISGLCAICKESQTSIRSALKELEEHKHLQRNRLKDDKGQFIYEYVIYELPYDGNGHTGSQSAEKLRAEDRTQQKNLEENIKNKELKEKDIDTNSFERVLSSIVNQELKDLYIAFIDAREAMGAPITQQGLKILIERCNKLSNHNIRVQKLLLETALVNGWKNVFLPKDEEVDAVNKQVLNELRGFYLDE